jgi:putative transposase
VGVPRKPREEVEGGVYHVYARGNDRRPIYLDDVDRRIYLAMLARTVRLTGWRCLAYCLMDNHVHLLVELVEANLAAGMQRLHGQYGQVHNRRHRRSGHLFQGRYGAVGVTSDAQLWSAVAYIVRNPVEAGLCSQPGAWPWSSHLATLGRAPGWLDAARLLSYFDAAGGDDPSRRYTELTAACAHRVRQTERLESA